MGGTPVTLDFSKAQPINPPASDADSGSGVTLDFSKAQRIGPTIGPRPATPISDAFNMTQEGRAEHPVIAKVTDLAKNAAEYGRLLSIMSPLLGGPAGEAIGALGAAPEVEASGGWLGEGAASGGANATPGYLARGASAVSDVAQKLGGSIVSVIKAHPVISTYVGTHLANALGIPLPKVLKAIALIPENPAP